MSANSVGEIFALFCKNRSNRICQLDVCVRKNVCIFHNSWCLDYFSRFTVNLYEL